MPVKILKGTIAEVPAKQAEVDLVLTTANYRKPLEKPHMSVFGLGAAKVRTELTELLKKIQAE